MNQRFDFTQLGGFPLEQDHLDFMQVSYRAAFGALSQLVGDKVILYGVQVQGGQVTDGWISYNGELMPFRGGAQSSGVVIQETGETLTYLDESPHTSKFTKYATCGSPATFNFSDLRRPQNFRDSWCTGDIKMVDCTKPYIDANFDAASGLGINERSGWAWCDGRNNTKDRRGLLSVGWHDRANNPSGAEYNSPGFVGGQLKALLTKLNIPKHDHTTHAKGAIMRNNGQQRGFLSRVQSLLTAIYSNAGSDFFGAAANPDVTMRTGDAGGDGNGNTTPFDIRNPFIVTLFIQKL